MTFAHGSGYGYRPRHLSDEDYDRLEAIPTDTGAVLAESRLMTGVTQVFQSYMESPFATKEAFSFLVKECITSVIPWEDFVGLGEVPMIVISGIRTS